MKTETREIYRCSHCGRVYLLRHACAKHEKWCAKNPDNMHLCFSCDNLIRDDYEISTYVGLSSRTIISFRCKLGDTLYGYKAEKCGHEDVDNGVRMPTSSEWCNDYEGYLSEPGSPKQPNEADFSV